MHLLDTSAGVKSATGNLSDYKRRMALAIRIIVMGANGGVMKIAVVGATGATGRRVVKHALAQGHFVTAVARHPEKLSSADRLSFVRGDVLSPGGLTGALDGVKAVISCIGPEKNLSPGTPMPVGIASILTECKRANVRRFILQSGIGLSDGRELSCPNRFAVRVSRRIFTAAITDNAVAERMTLMQKFANASEEELASSVLTFPPTPTKAYPR